MPDRTGSAGRPAPAVTAVPGPADPGHPAAIAAGTSPSPAASPSTAVTVAAGDSIQLALAGASVTLYGPGQLSPTPEGAIVDAARLVVDRPRGDAPWSVLYRGTKVVVSHGAFTIEGGAQARFRVVRGEIELHCPSGLQTIRSGGSSACEPVPEIRATPHVSAPRAAPAVAPAEAAPPAPRRAASPPPPAPPTAPPPTQAELYTAAESALARGDLDAAQEALQAVIDAATDSLDAAVALVDLARLAARRGDTGAALGYLTRLDHHPRRAWVAAPAAVLLESLARSDSIHTLDPP